MPDIDNFYLDMNGIIHPCSHPNNGDHNFRISEQEIFQNIEDYLVCLINIVKPTEVLFLAVDGVAPRAKMNQQRSRRFKTARDAELAEEKAIKEGEYVASDEGKFDSNCITPGTLFMENLDKFLQFCLARLSQNNDTWRKIRRVIYSSHLVPGEGEHKIMDFIRKERSSSGYNPRTRHCLYGLDADLILLGMSTHELYFSLLREEVKFGPSGNKKGLTQVVNIQFHMMHLSMLRCYLKLEFEDLEGQTQALGVQFNFENLIDDWVLMTFLIGNDFIPHIPMMHINKGAADKFFECYKRAFPLMQGFMVEKGRLNIKNFGQFLKEITAVEVDFFRDMHEGEEWLSSKKMLAEAFEQDDDECDSNFDFEANGQLERCSPVPREKAFVEEIKERKRIYYCYKFS